MKPIVKKVIQRIYRDHDNAFFLDSCKRPDILKDRLQTLFNKHCKAPEFINYRNEGPCIEWHIRFMDYQIEKHFIQVETILYISKLCPIFYVHHAFAFPNFLESQTMRFSGYGNHGYVQEQFNLHKELEAFFQSVQYSELNYQEFSEVICDLQFPDGVSIFGSQVTVQYALFSDLLLPPLIPPQ